MVKQTEAFFDFSPSKDLEMHQSLTKLPKKEKKPLTLMAVTFHFFEKMSKFQSCVNTPYPYLKCDRTIHKPQKHESWIFVTFLG